MRPPRRALLATLSSAAFLAAACLAAGPAAADAGGMSLSTRPPAPATPSTPAAADAASAASSPCASLGPPDDERERLPVSLLRSRAHGSLSVEVDVENGRVVDARDVDARGLGLSDEAILAWVRRWRFLSGRSAAGCRVAVHVEPD